MSAAIPCAAMLCLALVGAAILQKAWQRYIAFGCAAVEIALLLSIIWPDNAPG